MGMFVGSKRKRGSRARIVSALIPVLVHTHDGIYRGKEIKPPITNRKNANPQAVQGKIQGSALKRGSQQRTNNLSQSGGHLNSFLRRKFFLCYEGSTSAVINFFCFLGAPRALLAQG